MTVLRVHVRVISLHHSIRQNQKHNAFNIFDIPNSIVFSSHRLFHFEICARTINLNTSFIINQANPTCNRSIYDQDLASRSINNAKRIHQVPRSIKKVGAKIFNKYKQSMLVTAYLTRWWQYKSHPPFVPVKTTHVLADKMNDVLFQENLRDEPCWHHDRFAILSIVSLLFQKCSVPVCTQRLHQSKNLDQGISGCVFRLEERSVHGRGILLSDQCGTTLFMNGGPSQLMIITAATPAKMHSPISLTPQHRHVSLLVGTSGGPTLLVPLSTSSPSSNLT